MLLIIEQERDGTGSTIGVDQQDFKDGWITASDSSGSADVFRPLFGCPFD